MKTNLNKILFFLTSFFKSDLELVDFFELCLEQILFDKLQTKSLGSRFLE